MSFIKKTTCFILFAVFSRTPLINKVSQGGPRGRRETTQSTAMSLQRGPCPRHRRQAAGHIWGVARSVHGWGQGTRALGLQGANPGMRWVPGRTAFTPPAWMTPCPCPTRPTCILRASWSCRALGGRGPTGDGGEHNRTTHLQEAPSSEGRVLGSLRGTTLEAVGGVKLGAP